MSIILEPTFTIRPPMRESSTVAFNVTFLPVVAASDLDSFSDCALVSALAAGNTAVIKPSEQAPATAELIERLVPRHFPSDVVRVVNGDARVAADLVRLRFDHIFFTGGGRIGAKVLEGAAANLTPVTLELGARTLRWCLMMRKTWIMWPNMWSMPPFGMRVRIALLHRG